MVQILWSTVDGHVGEIVNRIVFRADASLDIGAGHVMRCLTLANALRDMGSECHFVCREHPGNLISLIQGQGHTVHILPVFNSSQVAETDSNLKHAEWLGASQDQDADACKILLKKIQPLWLVVDSYALDVRWEKAIRRHCGSILVIDDIADRAHDCDVLLDQTLGRDPLDYRYLVPDSCTLLCGAEYALLRPEFAQARPYSIRRRRSGQIKQILVTMGGVDQGNATREVLTALASAEVPQNCIITVVMGSTAPWIDLVREQAAAMPVTTIVKTCVNEMAKLMTESDLAIGASGATSWERCCLGLPSIMVVLAQNQQKVADSLQRAGAARLIPSAADVTTMLPTIVRELLQAPSKLQQMSDSAASVTDGKGSARLMGHLI